ncbi:tauPI-stichotoxin-Hcr2b-like [Pecten maximus]|uniref:tauPI-stichotoxin-Hcr2b-like n=1 Tax=Pecten maximus TaxID=6579 RepID=UPI001458E61B|nr:tauPI-stichotoxin-Hcr2b-like [Pecten maximus]
MVPDVSLKFILRSDQPLSTFPQVKQPEMETAMLKVFLLLVLINVTMGGWGPYPRTEICTAPPETGPCIAYFRRFFHVNGFCLPFVYGGCEGNANNHETFQDCLQACVLLRPSRPFY